MSARGSIWDTPEGRAYVRAWREKMTKSLRRGARGGETAEALASISRPAEGGDAVTVRIDPPADTP